MEYLQLIYMYHKVSFNYFNLKNWIAVTTATVAGFSLTTVKAFKSQYSSQLIYCDINFHNIHIFNPITVLTLTISTLLLFIIITLNESLFIVLFVWEGGTPFFFIWLGFARHKAEDWDVRRISAEAEMRIPHREL